MIISYSHKFIFIHVYKVAGSSVTNSLKKYATNIPNLTEIGSTFHHITARELKQKLPKNIYNSFFKFAFVRNPWDWLVSDYHFIKQFGSNKFRHRIIKLLSFEQFVIYKFLNPLRNYQKDFVIDNGGSIIIDFIGRFENLENDFALICKKIGIQEQLPHLGRSKHLQYKNYYNEKTKKLVYKAYRGDIKLFNYAFDS